MYAPIIVLIRNAVIYWITQLIPAGAAGHVGYGAVFTMHILDELAVKPIGQEVGVGVVAGADADADAAVAIPATDDVMIDNRAVLPILASDRDL